MGKAFSLKALCILTAMMAGLHSGAASATDADPAPNPASADIIARGAYLAKAGDCGACHTAPGGQAMAGGTPIDSPFGAIYSSNITPSKTHGIGNYTEPEFAQALRKGVRADGTNLYPAMPYPSYAGITDDDVKALYAYYMHAVEPVDKAAPQTQLNFPFNQRWLISGWNLLFAGGKPGAPAEDESAEWNRGRYLVETLGHCSSCHTPRNLAMGEKHSLALSGGQIGPWQTPNITSDPVSGIGGWSHQEIVQYLSTGAVAGKAHAAGGMAEAIEKSLQYLDEDDLSAIATYLKEFPPIRDPKDTHPSYSYAGNGQDYEASLRADNPGIGFDQPDPGYLKLTTGPQLYSAYCASCHQADGEGTPDEAFPSLTHNSVVGRNNADNLAMVILEGLSIQTQAHSRQMPGFGDELTDQQVATLASFVTQQFGNPDATISADRVSLLRNGGSTSSTALLLMAAAGILGTLFILFGIFWWIRHRKQAIEI